MPCAREVKFFALGFLLAAFATPCRSFQQLDVPVPPVVRLCVQLYPPFVVMRVRRECGAHAGEQRGAVCSAPRLVG